MNDFKTPELLNLLNFLKKQYPSKKSIINSFFKPFSTIDLSIHPSSQETFSQTVNLVTDETITLTYNISSLINKLGNSPYGVTLIDPYRLLNDSRFNKQAYLNNSIYNEVKSKLFINFTHKTDYIIITEISFFPGLFLIDGNHRFCHALITNQDKIKVCFVPESITVNYLQKDSFEFMCLLHSLNHFLS